MLLNILLVILVIDCIALTGVILLQRSEGGALGMGGGPQGMFTARGAGDLLTRTTAILTAIFFSLALIITLLAGHNRAGSSLTEHVKVNPLQLDALAKGQASAPAASSGPAAPPLPGSAPPLPGSTPAAPAQAQAARTVQRPSGALPGNLGMPNLPRSIGIPRQDLGAAAPAQPPASQSPAAPPAGR
jgi:preprotein translocase subunit SecG